MLLSIIMAIILLITLLIIIFLSDKFLKRYLYVYHLGDGSFSVRLFNIFPLLRIKYEAIEEVKQTSLGETNSLKYLNVTLRLGSLLRNKVMIKRKKWLFYKYLIITPDNAPKFVREMKERISFCQTEEDIVRQALVELDEKGVKSPDELGKGLEDRMGGK